MLVLREWKKSDTDRFIRHKSITIHESNLSCNNKTVAVFEKLLQKVEGSSTLCNKICIRCAFSDKSDKYNHTKYEHKIHFMLHVPLDSIIESVMTVGGVLLWVSSVCWDTQ